MFLTQASAALSKASCRHHGLARQQKKLMASVTVSTDDKKSLLAAPSVGRARHSSFTHVAEDGTKPTMVDVGCKEPTRRFASASCLVTLPPETLAALSAADSSQLPSVAALTSKKGPILGTAVVAGVMGAKQTSNLLPFCHSLPIEGVDVNVAWYSGTQLRITCAVSITHKTGVEMEALTGCSSAALCVYDMLKASSHDIVITDLRLEGKTGGKRHFERGE